MTNEELLQRITIDPKVCFGRPCVRGHRIWVSLVLDFLAQGATSADILKDYPQLEQADIMACLAQGAEMDARALRGSSYLSKALKLKLDENLRKRLTIYLRRRAMTQQPWLASRCAGLPNRSYCALS